MTFMAKEEMGPREREEEAPPSVWGETSWVQARFCCETAGQSLALSEPASVSHLARGQLDWMVVASSPVTREAQCQP